MRKLPRWIIQRWAAACRVALAGEKDWRGLVRTVLEHDQAREILGSGWIYWVIQSDSVGNLGVLAFNSEDYQMIVAGWILVESYEQFWAQLRFLLWRWRCVMPLGSMGAKLLFFLFWRMEHGITKNNNMLTFFKGGPVWWVAGFEAWGVEWIS